METLARPMPLLLVLLGFSVFVGCGNTTSRTPETGAKENASINLSAITGSNQTQMFTAVTEARQLPKAVLDRLSPIASPGQEFNSTDIGGDSVGPSRQLVAAALSRQYCIVSYWQGGFVLPFKTAVYELSESQARLIWRSEGQGGLNFLDLKRMVESGRMRDELTNQSLGASLNIRSLPEDRSPEMLANC
jgi:hypothetical protein